MRILPRFQHLREELLDLSMRMPSESELQQVVRRVVKRTLGAAEPNFPPAPSAERDAPSTPGRDTPPTPTPAAEYSIKRPVALGADHGGYILKESLKEVVASLGYPVIDCGTTSGDPVDYPDYAYAVARLVSEGLAWRGIVVDGAGIGSCMAANKVPGVRAALCYDHATAANSREHNDANVLTLGAGLIGPALAGQIARMWLATEFGGGRHARRVEKIGAIERRFLKPEKQS